MRIRNLGTISPQVDAHRQMGLKEAPSWYRPRPLSNEMHDPKDFEWEDSAREFHENWDFIPAAVESNGVFPPQRHESWPTWWADEDYDGHLPHGAVARVAHPSPYPE